MASNPSLELQQLEELAPTSTWEAFVEAEVKRGAWTRAQADQLRKAGLELLASVEVEQTKKRSKTESPSSTGSQLEFHSLTLSGFGPVDSSVDSPLNRRGLVLVRGTNQDGGSDSNGTGKSSLAMASLWALTGALDPRPLPDGKVADIVLSMSDFANKWQLVNDRNRQRYYVNDSLRTFQRTESGHQRHHENSRQTHCGILEE